MQIVSFNESYIALSVVLLTLDGTLARANNVSLTWRWRKVTLLRAGDMVDLSLNPLSLPSIDALSPVLVVNDEGVGTDHSSTQRESMTIFK